LIGNNYFAGIGLLILYALVFVVRQVAEPRIVSSSLGLHPVSVLAAIFIGLKANGIAGMFFCMFLVVFYNIFKKVNII
jgi:predicted PurR-regulated permease PerM